jgi:putative phosphoribosyl transferase
MFTDRLAAGRELAIELARVVSGPVVVLGIPRGGVVVAAPVARALEAPLDVVVPRKLGAPGNPELGIGAVAPGVRFLDEALVSRLGVSDEFLERETAQQIAEVERRSAAYRGARAEPDLTGATAVIVDDGVATGGTALAAVAWARERAGRVVFAAPVAPASTAARIDDACDDVVFLLTPARFVAVGQWYGDFGQVSDEEARAALEALP